MELIKKIKQSEAQAQEIIDQAKAEIARQAEKGQEYRRQAVAEAEQEREKTIEVAVATAQSQGLAETDRLKAQAEKEREELRAKADSKIATAVAKVMDYLGSHFAKEAQNGGPLRG